MNKFFHQRGWLLGMTLLVWLTPARADVPAGGQLTARLVKVRAHVADVTKVAEEVAQRWVDRQQVLVHAPFGGDGGTFAMEMIARAGGLDNIRPNTTRIKERTANDVAIYGVRSWEKDVPFFCRDAMQAKQSGWLVIAFGSRAGVPDNMPLDEVVDNFAAGPGEEEAAVNHMVNLVNGWIFQCELTSALTRLGWRPGVLKGMLLPGATLNNLEYQIGTPTLYPCAERIPAGKLGAQYLDNLEKALAELKAPFQQKQIARAAELAAAKIKDGKNVWMSSCTHTLDGEVFWDNRSPLKAFRGISCGPHGELFTNNVKPNDLLFWFGEWTMNSGWRDYLALIRSTHAEFIPSYRPETEAMEPIEHGNIWYDFKTPDAAMVLEQHWPFENAVVDIPFPPGRMAPVSGVYVCLMYRMLDEAIAQRLAVVGEAGKK